MSSKTDQKSLELLYESIAEEFPLLKEEEEFIEECSRLIIENAEEQLKSTRSSFLSDITLFDFLSYSPTKDALKKLDLSKEELKNFNYVYNWIYINYAQKVLLKRIKNVNYFRIKGTFRYEDIEFDNKEQLLETFKQLFKDFVIYMLKSIILHLKDKPESFQTYIKCREEKLKFQSLKKKLPELEGIFD